jgi:hypothetical protein
MRLTRTFNSRFPQRGTPVMSSLRPLPEKREPLVKVSAGGQCADEAGYLSCVGRTVRFERHDDVTSSRREASAQGVHLARPVCRITLARGQSPRVTGTVSSWSSRQPRGVGEVGSRVMRWPLISMVAPQLLPVREVARVRSRADGPKPPPPPPGGASWPFMCGRVFQEGRVPAGVGRSPRS